MTRKIEAEFDEGEIQSLAIEVAERVAAKWVQDRSPQKRGSSIKMMRGIVARNVYIYLDREATGKAVTKIAQEHGLNRTHVYRCIHSGRKYVRSFYGVK